MGIMKLKYVLAITILSTSRGEYAETVKTRGVRLRGTSRLLPTIDLNDCCQPETTNEEYLQCVKEKLDSIPPEEMSDDEKKEVKKMVSADCKDKEDSVPPGQEKKEGGGDENEAMDDLSAEEETTEDQGTDEGEEKDKESPGQLKKEEDEESEATDETEDMNQGQMKKEEETKREETDETEDTNQGQMKKAEKTESETSDEDSEKENSGKHVGELIKHLKEAQDEALHDAMVASHEYDECLRESLSMQEALVAPEGSEMYAEMERAIGKKLQECYGLKEVKKKKQREVMDLEGEILEPEE